MMTAQMSRTAVTSWSTLFPTEQNTVAQSALFVKKLLAVGLSSITYLRTLFPEGAYSDRDLDGLKLKMLQDNSDCQGANTLISWIKSAFQALDKQYLRQLTLTLHTDPKEYEKAIESYTYKISYSKDKEAFISELLTKIESIEKKYDVRRSTQKMLRTVLLLTQSLKPLPSKVFLTMQLQYYDEVTPPEYEPAGFKPATPPSSHSLGDPVTIKVGDVCTPFHTVKLRVTVNKAVYSDDKEENEQQNMAITEDKENPQAGNEQAEESSGLENAENPLPSSDSVIIRCHKRSKKHTADLVPQCHMPQESLTPKEDPPSSMCFGQDKQDSTSANPQQRSESAPQDDCVPSITPVSKSCSVAQVISTGSGEEVQIVPEVEPKEDQDGCPSVRRSRRLHSFPSAVTPTASVSSVSDTSPMKNDKEPVRCECGVHYDDGLMILCDICKTWQHALCFKLSKKDEVPERHLCLQCSVTSGLPCTDSSFRDMPKEKVQRICLLRRALEFLSGYYARVTIPKLGQRLGVDISQAQKLMGHLDAMRVFRDRGKRRHRVVNKTKVKRAYSEYFSSQPVLMEGEFEDTQVLQTPKQKHQEVGSDSDMTPDLRLPMQVLGSEMESSHDIPAPDSQDAQVVDTYSERTIHFIKEPQGEGLLYTQEGEVVDSTQDVPVGTQKIITLGTGFDETFSIYSPVSASQVFATAGNTVATLGDEVEEMTNICYNPVDSTTAGDIDTAQVSTSSCNEISMTNKSVTKPVNTSQGQITEHPGKSAAPVFESADIWVLPGSSNIQEHQSQMNAEVLQGVACRSVELHVENPASRRALMTRSNRLSRNKTKLPVTMNLNDFEISSSQGSPTPEHQWKGKRAKIL